MKITNRTHYDTKKLRKLFCVTHNKTARFEGRLKTWKELKVEIVYGKDYTGDAWLGGDPRSEIKVRIPKSGASYRWTAMVFDHELLHVYGYDHDKMGPIRWLNKGILCNYDWAVKLFGTDDIPDGNLKSTTKVKPTTLEIQKKRENKVLKKEKEWQDRLKKSEAALGRAEKALAKIDRQKKYYKKVIAISAEAAITNKEPPLETFRKVAAAKNGRTTTQETSKNGTEDVKG